MFYKKFNTYNTLRAVMLGSYFYPDYFSKIINPKIREPLMRMADEINQDLEKIESVLKQNSLVIRAPQPQDYFDETNPYQASLQVRNCHAVIGNKMYKFHDAWYDNIDETLSSYCPDMVDLVDSNKDFYLKSMAKAYSNYNKETKVWHCKQKYHELAGPNWPKYEDFVCGAESNIPSIQKEMQGFAWDLVYETRELAPLQGPNVINTNESILVDNNEYCNYAEWLQPYVDSRPIQQFISKAGHVDGCFAVLGNQTILGIDPFIDYNKYFPGYDIIKVPEENYQDKIEEFKIMKTKVDGRWWLAGEEHNNEFINYVDTHLKSWVGHVFESIFDVNVLALDENTILTSNVTDDIRQKLKKQKIECITVPWRHRFFVDGGLHCITLDLNRD